MYFGLVLPPSGLKFTFVGLFSSTFLPPWSPRCLSGFTSPTGACVGQRGSARENWPCCTVIGEDVKLFKKILKLFLFCLFVLNLYLSFNYPLTPLQPPVATWRTLWQISALLLSRSAPLGPCCFPTCRRHPPKWPPRHTGNQKTSATN